MSGIRGYESFECERHTSSEERDLMTPAISSSPTSSVKEDGEAGVSERLASLISVPQSSSSTLSDTPYLTLLEALGGTGNLGPPRKKRKLMSSESTDFVDPVPSSDDSGTSSAIFLTETWHQPTEIGENMPSGDVADNEISTTTEESAKVVPSSSQPPVSKLPKKKIDKESSLEEDPNDTPCSEEDDFRCSEEDDCICSKKEDENIPSEDRMLVIPPPTKDFPEWFMEQKIPIHPPASHVSPEKVNKRFIPVKKRRRFPRRRFRKKYRSVIRKRRRDARRKFQQSKVGEAGRLKPGSSRIETDSDEYWYTQMEKMRRRFEAKNVTKHRRRSAKRRRRAANMQRVDNDRNSKSAKREEGEEQEEVSEEYIEEEEVSEEYMEEEEVSEEYVEEDEASRRATEMLRRLRYELERKQRLQNAAENDGILEDSANREVAEEQVLVVEEYVEEVVVETTEFIGDPPVVEREGTNHELTDQEMPTDTD